MSNSEDKKLLRKLDKIAKTLTHDGIVENLTVPTPSDYLVTITSKKYREIVKTGQNPITQIVNVTSSATARAKSSLSVSQEIQNIMRDLEKSNLDPKRLPEVRNKLNTLEKELDKPNPSEKVIRKIMRWASNFGLELSLRIAVLIAERLLKPT